MYDAIFDPSAIDFLNSLEKAVKDYRVVADIDQSTSKIQVTLIGHRKNVYKRMA